MYTKNSRRLLCDRHVGKIWKIDIISKTDSKNYTEKDDAQHLLTITPSETVVLNGNNNQEHQPSYIILMQRYKNGYKRITVLIRLNNLAPVPADCRAITKIKLR